MGEEKAKPLAPPNHKLPSIVLKAQSTWNEHHLLSAARAKEIRDASKTNSPSESTPVVDEVDDEDALGSIWGWWNGKRR